MKVTTTSLRQGKFETRFWHKVFEEEVGRVKGHFGPINTYVRNIFPPPPGANWLFGVTALQYTHTEHRTRQGEKMGMLGCTIMIMRTLTRSRTEGTW